MDNILSILVVVGLSFWGGWMFREYQARKRIDQLLDMMEEEGVGLTSGPTPRKIRIEKVKEVFYIYDLDTDEFLAQGDTRAVLEKNLAERFPNNFFAATAANLKEVGFE